jgi:hypothetical protein
MDNIGGWPIETTNLKKVQFTLQFPYFTVQGVKSEEDCQFLNISTSEHFNFDIYIF